jgi:hypothetical protein
VTLLVEKGDPKPWVGVEWTHDGAAVRVTCSHCGKDDATYAVYVRQHQDWIEQTVAKHNRHVDSPADDNREWQPGTP